MDSRLFGSCRAFGPFNLLLHRPTCVSGLFSSHRCINAFGALAFILAIAAHAVSVKTFVSVWCFFAAILSLLVYAHFSGPMQACHPAFEAAAPQAGAVNQPTTEQEKQRYPK